MLSGSYIKIWNLGNHMKKWSKEHQTLSFQFFINTSSILMLFVSSFHVVCKISKFNMWTAKHLALASCTELTLKGQFNKISSSFLWYLLPLEALLVISYYTFWVEIHKNCWWTTHILSSQMKKASLQISRIKDS